MRAVVQHGYGAKAALGVEVVPDPTIGDDEVLVRVRAASVHPDVWHVVSGRPFVLRLMGSGLRRPRSRVPGTDVAGVVTAVGPAVTRFAVGDEVFGETLRGFQWHNGGAYAELVAVPEDNLAPRPERLSFEQAACLPTAGLIAVFNLPTGDRLRAGHHVLVNGAGGGVGSIAVQLAKAAGAVVTAVDSAAKLDLLRTLGADEVIDFTTEDFTRGDARYDLVFDIVGNHGFRAVRRVLTHDGTYVLVGHDGFGSTAGRWLGSIPRVLGLVALTPFTRHLSTQSFSPPPKREVMDRLCALVEEGSLTAVVAATYALEDVPTALRHLQEGSARGRIVVTP